MSLVLIDSSVWISYFKGDPSVMKLSELIESNRICTNPLILAELLPSLIHKKEFHLVELMRTIRELELVPNWEALIDMQTINLKNGLNRVGIPDLLIAHYCIEKDVELYTLDKHFKLMQNFFQLKLFS